MHAALPNITNQPQIAQNNKKSSSTNAVRPNIYHINYNFQSVRMTVLRLHTLRSEMFEEKKSPKKQVNHDAKIV